MTNRAALLGVVLGLLFIVVIFSGCASPQALIRTMSAEGYNTIQVEVSRGKRITRIKGDRPAEAGFWQ